MEIGHEIISMIILSQPLIQVGQLSVAGKKDVHLVLVNCLWSLPRNNVDRSIEHLNMTLKFCCWLVKLQIKQEIGSAQKKRNNL